MASRSQSTQDTHRRRTNQLVIALCFSLSLGYGALAFAADPPDKPTTPPSASAPATPLADSVTSNPEYQRLYNEAATALSKKDYVSSLSKLDELDKAFPNAVNALNLRGALYTEQRDFPKALETFTRANEIDKKAFAPRFNLGEVLFLQKKYPEARARFEVLQSEDLKNDLVRYKVFLCFLAAGDKDKAEKILDQFNFAGDLPGYYFAHAAWDFSRSNVDDASGWLQSAGSIYSQQVNLMFIDSLMELGYLKRPENPPEPAKTP